MIAEDAECSPRLIVKEVKPEMFCWTITPDESCITHDDKDIVLGKSITSKVASIQF